MTIQLTPEQEQVIGRAIQAGLIKTADEIVDVGVETLRRQIVGEVYAIAEDALKGLDMERRREEPPVPASPSRAVEWLREFHTWVHSHPTNTPLLSDEAIDRESIYGTRGQ